MLIHHNQSLLSVQWEWLFPHINSEHQSGVMTHQLPLLPLMISLWINSHQSIFIAFIRRTRNLSLWPTNQYLRAIPYCMIFFRDTWIKPCNTHKCSLVIFLHHVTKAWYTRNSILLHILILILPLYLKYIKQNHKIYRHSEFSVIIWSAHYL